MRKRHIVLLALAYWCCLNAHTFVDSARVAKQLKRMQEREGVKSISPITLIPEAAKAQIIYPTEWDTWITRRSCSRMSPLYALWVKHNLKVSDWYAFVVLYDRHKVIVHVQMVPIGDVAMENDPYGLGATMDGKEILWVDK